MIRDRAVRTFSVIVAVAALAALVGAAGAEWDGAPARHHVASASSSVSADRASVLAAHASIDADDPLPFAGTHAVHHARPVRIVLPRSLPARYLPVGAQLPNPAALPSNAWAQHAVTQIGTIGIPAIALSSPIFEGVDQSAFAHGPGHWPGTAMPGAWGNAVFGGHRTTQTHPFLDTDRLRAGDEIDFAMRDGWTYVYRVTRVFVVADNALWIKNQGPGRTVTLFTCNPKGSATSRLVTNGVLDRVVATA